MNLLWGCGGVELIAKIPSRERLRAMCTLPKVPMTNGGQTSLGEGAVVTPLSQCREAICRRDEGFPVAVDVEPCLSFPWSLYMLHLLSTG